jgi:hypothetical protein
MTCPERYERVLTISERAYKALLTVYPKEFRDEYGPQMVRDFWDLCREELERGGVAGFARLWGAQPWILQRPRLWRGAIAERTMRR